MCGSYQRFNSYNYGLLVKRKCKVKIVLVSLENLCIISNCLVLVKYNIKYVQHCNSVVTFTHIFMA